MTRIEKMVQNWREEGRAFSNLSNDDNEFFNEINISSECVGITSRTGLDLVYYDTEIYNSDTNALRKIRI